MLFRSDAASFIDSLLSRNFTVSKEFIRNLKFLLDTPHLPDRLSRVLWRHRNSFYGTEVFDIIAKNQHSAPEVLLELLKAESSFTFVFESARICRLTTLINNPGFPLEKIPPYTLHFLRASDLYPKTIERLCADLPSSVRAKAYETVRSGSLRKFLKTTGHAGPMETPSLGSRGPLKQKTNNRVKFFAEAARDEFDTRARRVSMLIEGLGEALPHQDSLIVETFAEDFYSTLRRYEALEETSFNTKAEKAERSNLKSLLVAFKDFQDSLEALHSNVLRDKSDKLDSLRFRNNAYASLQDGALPSLKS